MAAVCAKRPAGVDVNRTVGIAAVNVAFGRLARLENSPREGPESAVVRRSFPACGGISERMSPAAVAVVANAFARKPEEQLPIPDVAGEHRVRGVPRLLPNFEGR